MEMIFALLKELSDHHTWPMLKNLKNPLKAKTGYLKNFCSVRFSRRS